MQTGFEPWHGHRSTGFPNSLVFGFLALAASVKVQVEQESMRIGNLERKKCFKKIQENGFGGNQGDFVDRGIQGLEQQLKDQHGCWHQFI